MFISESISLTESLLTCLLKQPYVAFLDCNSQQGNVKEQSIIGLDPKYKFFVKDDQIIVKEDNKDTVYKNQNIFNIIENYIEPCKENECNQDGFASGFIGMFTYESARNLNDFSWLKKAEYPEVIGGIYDRYIIIDHQKEVASFVSSRLYGRDYIKFQAILDNLRDVDSAFVVTDKIDYPDKQEYKKKIKKILEYIKQGDTYQVNVSMPYSVKVKGCLSTMYHVLRQVSPAPYSAYLNYEDYHILSSSPELFFQKIGSRIITKPIKGTIRRGSSIAEDQYQKELLVQSSKDQAELLMIVDLERNDLNKICQTGTVVVKQLREIKAYQYVHHGVATIEGELKEGVNFFEIMKALFPGGSITGAPKKRSMEIIDECEIGERGPYTGCVGYISGNKNMIFNIAIRTLYTNKNRLFCHAGGGIVADSDSDFEWQECEIKAKGMLDSLLRFNKTESLSK